MATDASTADWLSAWATVVAAVGTVGALIAALVQIARERAVRLRSERVAQASRVSAWYVRDDEHRTDVALLNDAEEPVYRVLIFLVMIQGAGPTIGEEVVKSERFDHWAGFGVLPPGRYHAALGSGWRGMMRQAGIEIAFTDRSGAHWVRRASGALVELPQDPVDHYAIPLPIVGDAVGGLAERILTGKRAVVDLTIRALGHKSVAPGLRLRVESSPGKWCKSSALRSSVRT